MALTIARDRLPFSQDHPNDTVSIQLKVEEFYKDPLHIWGIGATGLDKEVSFNFQKMYVNDILIGWEFVGVRN